MVLFNSSGDDHDEQRIKHMKKVEGNSIQISIDGKGCLRDNVLMERLWSSDKYGGAFLYVHNSASAAERRLEKYYKQYNQYRPHIRSLS